MILHDCTIHCSTVSNELFIVEGLSAADNLKRARDSKTQAVLALQGKPANAARTSHTRVKKHPGLQAIVSALGCGMGDSFDVEKLRYKRIVLLFDPDADGIHCCALMQIFFQKYMPKLIESERVFVLRAPMFAISVGQDSDPIIAYSQEHYDKLCEHLSQSTRGDFHTTRFKGVASLNVALLRTTCLDNESRKTHQLNTQDALLATSLFSGAS